MTQAQRDIVFISKATPGDNEFALWLAPRLEAEGYTVFADIRDLDGGDRWRRNITDTLQERAVKMLLCCSDSTLAREGVQEEIEIAKDLSKSLKDEAFIIPLRLEPYKKLLGIGGLQYVDFVRGWATGLDNLLGTLKRRKVPRDRLASTINPNWESYRRRGAVPILPEPERLTSNWLRVTEVPTYIHHYETQGSVDTTALANTSKKCAFPVHPRGPGFLCFADQAEVDEAFRAVARFKKIDDYLLTDFVSGGAKALGLKKDDASKIVHAMFRDAWSRFCCNRGFLEFAYSTNTGFHASTQQCKIGGRIPWGRQGERRWSMLRNIAKGCVWEYGVSAIPAFWPYYHFKLKSRVLFSPVHKDENGSPFEDAKKQHKLRRSVCKGWRNKQWYGRLLAFLELLSQDSAFIKIPLATNNYITLEASPLLFTSPVRTPLPDQLQDDEEEQDQSTLGRPEPDEEQ